ncbi:MAG: BatA and WFA domain-containing protein [Anaerolineae bacterium]|nr:BatA and WFA domain-containing protein [Anaerolineae bacterium]
MTLLAPLALLGTLTLPIIILLHLLSTRRKPLLVSSMRLWDGLQQKKQGVVPRYIPISLMLILQLGVATALTLALARPAFSFLLHQPQHVIFILDTTTSMAAQDAGQSASRFDLARQVIQNRIQEMYDNDSLVVIGLNRRPEIILNLDGQQKAQAQAALDPLTPGATGLDLPAALSLANGLVNPNRETQITVLTDGNYSLEADDLPPMQLPVTWQFIPPEPSAPNQALLNVSAQTWPDGRHRLFARVVNYSDTPVNRTLQILVNGQPAGQSTVALGPHAETTRAWTLPPATQTAAVELIESDALPLDNRSELFLTGAMQRQTLLVSDVPEPQDKALARALEAQGVELTIADTASLNRYELTDFDLVVFDGLPLNLTWWPEGNLLVVNPPLDHELLPAGYFAYDVRPDDVTASDLLTGIDWSGVFFGQVPNVTLPNWIEPDLMSFPLTEKNLAGQVLDSQNVDRLPLIFHGATGHSRIVAWAFNLNESNLAGRLALPLLTANAMSYLLAASDTAAVALGEPVLLDQNLSVETPDGRRLFLPSPAQDERSKFTQTTQPGLYKIFNESDRLAGAFAVQAGSALESNLTARFAPEILTGLETTATTSPEKEYFELWPWLVGLVLVVVGVEGWLAWRR